MKSTSEFLSWAKESFGNSRLLCVALAALGVIELTPRTSFANGSWDQPVLTRGGYRPGSEVDAVAGNYFDGWKFGDVKVAPLAQVIGSYRLHDEGPAAMPDDTGYERILLSPGIEVETAGLGIYADVGFPVFEHVRGNQLVASALFKINVSYSF